MMTPACSFPASSKSVTWSPSRRRSTRCRWRNSVPPTDAEHGPDAELGERDRANAGAGPDVERARRRPGREPLEGLEAGEGGRVLPGAERHSRMDDDPPARAEALSIPRRHDHQRAAGD